MENNDGQQEGGLFGEKDIFARPSDGEAVSQDAGQDDWGGLLDWDLPQEEEQQGFAEGAPQASSQEQQGVAQGEYDPGFFPEGVSDPGTKYDSGFAPEGGYDSGGEYDPGFTPTIPEDKLYEEPVDAPAADPWGSTPSRETAGQAGADTGDAEIEMHPEDIGWGTPSSETVGPAVADSGDGAIQMSAKYAGPAGADTKVDENDIEMLPDDAGQTGDDAGSGETEEIEITPEEAARVPEHEQIEMFGDERDDHYQQLEARYDKVFADMEFQNHEELAQYYKNLSEVWSDTDKEPTLEGLETDGKLKLALYDLWEQREQRDPEFRDFIEERGHALAADEDVKTETTPEDAGQADPKVDENDIEMLSDDAGQAGADAGNGEIEMTGNEKIETTEDGEVKMTGEKVGPFHIGYPREVSEDEAREKGLDGDNETEISPEDARRLADFIYEIPGVGGAIKDYVLDTAHEEELANLSYEELAGYYRETFNSLPDNYRINGTLDDRFDPSSREALDTYEELKAATKGLLKQRDLQNEADARLEDRYGKELAGDPDLQTYDQLADYYKTLSRVLTDSDQDPDMTGLDTYERLKAATYWLWRDRDSYLKQHEGEQRLEEKGESHTDDSGGLPFVDFFRDMIGFDDSDQAALEGYHHDDVGHGDVADHGDDLWG